MYASPMNTELAAARHRDLILAAAAHRLVRQARQARSAERRNSTTQRVHRTWVRSAIQPAQI
jgi:hypothetical protein